jgi:hypothetical protein
LDKDYKDLYNLLIVLLLIFIVWKFLKPKISLAGTYTNKEEWEIERNPDGSLKKIIVHRKAKEE